MDEFVPSSTSEASPSSDNATTPTETHLITLTKMFIELMNARAYDDPFFKEYVAPNVFVDLQGNKTVGLEGFLGNYKKDAELTPTFHVGIVNSTAMVDEPKGRATVILSQDLQGLGGPDKKMAGTILMSWEKDEQKWTCKSVCMMLGTPEFLV